MQKQAGAREDETAQGRVERHTAEAAKPESVRGRTYGKGLVYGPRVERFRKPAALNGESAGDTSGLQDQGDRADETKSSASEWFEMQFSIHKAEGLVKREACAVFPELRDVVKKLQRDQSTSRDAESADTLYAIATIQPSKVDMVEWSSESAAEKDRLLENFVGWATAFCARIKQRCDRTEPERGDDAASTMTFADFVEPCSGHPGLGTRSSSIYSEVDSMQFLLKYPAIQVAQCTVISHPIWRTNIYPATLFVVAPLNIIIGTIDNMLFRESSREPME